jgi:hypothetical protein
MATLRIGKLGRGPLCDGASMLRRPACERVLWGESHIVKRAALSRIIPWKGQQVTLQKATCGKGQCVEEPTVKREWATLRNGQLWRESHFVWRGQLGKGPLCKRARRGEASMLIKPPGPPLPAAAAAVLCGSVKDSSHESLTNCINFLRSLFLFLFQIYKNWQIFNEMKWTLEDQWERLSNNLWILR